MKYGGAMKRGLQISLSIILVVLSFTTFSFAQAEFETGKIGAIVNIYGRVRVYYPTLDTRQIDRISIALSKAPSEVFDYKNDTNPEDTVALLKSAPTDGLYEIYGSFNNSYFQDSVVFHTNPPDVLEKLNVYGWENEQYLIAKFTMLNREAAAFEAIPGFEIVPMIDGAYGNEVLNCLADKGIAEIYVADGTHVGLKILSKELTGFMAIDYPTDDYWLGDTTIYDYLTYTGKDTEFQSSGDGGLGVMTTAPENLGLGDSLVIYMGISVGATRDEMLTVMTAAEAKYASVFTSVERNEGTAPKEYSLKQNYPNPFNPGTTIKWQQPKQGFTTLKIFNTLGNEVATLVNQELNAGSYSVNYDAGRLSSGIYFYTLTTGNFSSTKKMILVK
ncbi:MAG: T9SS C-terminal target domain-containing protein [Ignavibacteriales bacterium]|nr:MAG: T9SS C-terminal target domain-containing protein [Ignavibacteriales bacterium]